MKGEKILFSDFVKRAKEVHGDKYIYNENEFNNKDKKNSKFNIECPIHGIFKESSYNHLTLGRGCPICQKLQKQEEHRQYIKKILEKAKFIHNNYYDYSQVDLNKSVRDKVIIICPTHGSFLMSLDSHINAKAKCHKCQNMVRHTFEEFKELSYEKFGTDAFDFSNCDYKSWQENITFKCNKCGEMITRQPKVHLTTRGCPYCLKYGEEISYPQKWINFINNKPSHIEVKLEDYKGATTPIKIICHKKNNYGEEHGEYYITPNGLYNSSNYGCEKCSNKPRRTTQQCVRDFQEKFGDKYIYDKFEYLGKQTSTIICPKHGEFQTTYYRMMKNCEPCPQCNNQIYYYEAKLKYDLSEIYKFEFQYNIRPQWLKNEDTNHNQELDIFIPEYNIGIEYQGRHHFKDIYNNKNNFTHLCELDKMKYEKCKKLGIKILYYTEDKRDVPSNYIDKVYTDFNELCQAIDEYIKTKE